MGTPRIDDSWGKPNGRIDVAGTPGSPTIRWRARYIGFNRWVQAVRQAGTTDIDAVRQAMYDQTVPNLTGGIAVMNITHHLSSLAECSDQPDQAPNLLTRR